MRLAIIAPGYPPMLGGVQESVASVATRLAKLDIEVEVWAPDRTSSLPSVRTIDELTVRLFPSTRSHRFGVSPRLFAHAARHLREFDVVHVHSYYVSTCLAAGFAPADTPIVFTPHYHGPGDSAAVRLVNPLYRPLANRVLRRASTILAVSEAESLLLGHTFPDSAHRISLIRNAVSVEDIHQATPWPDTPPTLIVLGRLERYKRVDLALEAFGATKTPGRLVIIGHGPEATALTRLARDNPRADDIRVMGYLPRHEVSRWLRTARGLVSLSQREAFGIVAHEAVTAGARAILSEVPAHREAQAVLGADVVQLMADNPRDIAAAMDDALQTPNRGPVVLRDWSAVAAELFALYRRLTDAAASPS